MKPINHHLITGLAPVITSSHLKIIDRYILRRFAITLFFAIIFFVVMVICVDMVGNLAKFIDKEVPNLVIFKYYLYYIPFIINTLGLPMAMLLASMFSIGHLAKYNELTAIKSAGVSMTRILSAVLIAALFISALAFILSEKIVPAAIQGKARIEDQYLEKTRTLTSLQNILVRDALNRPVFIARYNTTTNVAQRVTVQTYQGNQIIARTDIRSMKWKDDHWVLKDGYKRTFLNGMEEATPFEEEPETHFKFTPEKLMKSQAKPEDMSYRQLQNFITEVIRNGGNPAKWQVDLNFKLSLPLANFILVLFGAPLASNKQRSGAVFGLILSAGIFLVYFGAMRFVQTLGELGHLHPFVAAWLPNGIFLLIGSILLWKSR